MMVTVSRCPRSARTPDCSWSVFQDAGLPLNRDEAAHAPADHPTADAAALIEQLERN